jgi:LPXTG-motif cell wall-anchored protein
VYPDRAHDAETLLADPKTGQLFVASKDIFGGTLYAAPQQLSTDHPNRLTAVGGAPSVATDGAFFPDGRHYVVRGYTRAVIYTYPGHESVGSFRLPDQQQGEGISVGSDGALYLSTEGQFSEVLRMPVPPDVAAAMQPKPVEQPAAAVDEPAPEDELRWPWLAAAGAVFVGGAGWLLLRRGKAA